VDHREIDVCTDDFTGFSRLAARVIAENFLGDGVAHR